MKNEANPQEEIDLRFLYRKIKESFSNLWGFLKNTIINIFTLLQKRWGFIFIFCLLGAGAGAGLYYVIRPVYSSTIVLSSATLRNDYCADLVYNLDLFIRDRTPDALAKKLKISVASAKSIKDLEFDNYDEKLKKKYENKDTIVLGLPFKIRAYAYSNVVFDTLEPALVNYMENNEYALKRKEIKIANLKSLKEKINSNIHQLDSLKLIVAANMLPRGIQQNGFVFGQPIDPMNMFKEEINLFKEDLSIRKDLQLSDNIQIIQDFVPRTKPDYPRLRINVPIGGFIGFILGLIIAFYLEKRKIKSIAV